MVQTISPSGLPWQNVILRSSSSNHQNKPQFQYYHPLNQWLVRATNSPLQTPLHTSAHLNAPLCTPLHTSMYHCTPVHDPPYIHIPLHAPPHTSIHPYVHLCTPLCNLCAPQHTSVHCSANLGIPPILPCISAHLCVPLPTFVHLLCTLMHLYTSLHVPLCTLHTSVQPVFLCRPSQTCLYIHLCTTVYLCIPLCTSMHPCA